MPTFRALLSGLLLSALLAVPAFADPVPEPEVTLIVPGGEAAEAGRHALALRIAVPSDWHVYWRTPGEAGLATEVRLEGENIAGSQVQFPAPVRLDDSGIETLVHHGGVVLPLEVTAADPAMAVEGTVEVSFGYCREICVPGAARLAFRVGADTPFDARATLQMQRAEAAVPTVDDGIVAAVERREDAAGGRRLAIAVRADDAEAVDLFAEGPTDWYLPQPTPAGAGDGVRWFDLDLGGVPPGARDATLRFTATIGGAAFETTRRLPD